MPVFAGEENRLQPESQNPQSIQGWMLHHQTPRVVIRVSEVQRQQATKHCQPPQCERMGNWALNPRWAVWAALASTDFGFPRNWLVLQRCLAACLGLSEPCIYYQPFLSSENLSQSSAQWSCPQGSIILVNTNIIKASRRAGRLLMLNESSLHWMKAQERWFLWISSKYTTALRYKNHQAVSTILKVFCLFFSQHLCIWASSETFSAAVCQIILNTIIMVKARSLY